MKVIKKILLALGLKKNRRLELEKAMHICNEVKFTATMQDAKGDRYHYSVLADNSYSAKNKLKDLAYHNGAEKPIIFVDIFSN